MVMNQMGNNMQNYLQPQSQLNNIPNGINNSYDYNNYSTQNPQQINEPSNHYDPGYGIQPQYSDQNQINQLPFEIPINSNLINNSINNPNSLMGGILDNIGGDDRKKKNNDEYKKLLLDQIERKKCKF